MKKTFPTTSSFTSCASEIIGAMLQEMPIRIRIIEAGKGIVILPDTGGKATDSELIKALHLREADYQEPSASKNKYLLINDWGLKAPLLLTDEQYQVVNWLGQHGWLQDFDCFSLGTSEFIEI